MGPSAIAMGLLGIVYLAAAGASWGAPATQSLRNGYLRVQVSGASLRQLQADPDGKGKKSLEFARDLRPEFWQETSNTKLTLTDNKAVVAPLEIWPYQPLEIGGQMDHPDKLEPKHTLAQRFQIAPGFHFSSLAIKMPTWNSTSSGATLSLYQAGKLLGSRKLENVKDNSWQELSLENTLGEGAYELVLSDPMGEIGWWSSGEDSSPLGEALADGNEAPKDRALRVDTFHLLGTGTLEFGLNRNTLEVTAQIRPQGEMSLKSCPWRWRMSWTRDGYDCTPKAGVVFSRFFADNQRYMPIQQLKRREHGGLSFEGCRWIEMEGNQDADLRLEGEKLHLHWEMQPTEMSLRFDTPFVKQGELWKSEFRLVALPRKDSVPEDFPRFACSDPKLEADLNRFWWERGFSYGAPVNRSVEWGEWMALIRSWFSGPLRDGEMKALAEQPMTDEGYVHTYGNFAGWPLVRGAQYDTRHFDSNARFILGCWRHYLWTGDMGFLRGQAQRLRSAMRYQLDVLKGREGLIVAPEAKTARHKDLSNNYWDILPFGHLDAFANAAFYGSLTAMEQIERALGESMLADYAALREKARARYDEAFWDESKGRYVGCVDIDGAKHDYGFTFVNLEALYYGLGDAAKAKRIYHWMETEPTSSGKPDTYSRWIFAPRASTVHNPMWREDAPPNELADPSKPWWTFWWRGTRYGEQCQDGGAILYTSFFDLMDRLRFRGIENAWERFGAIMARYRLPDRLCGGSPLYRGEKSQQEDAGSVGVDYPFPESALVPCFFLYGVMGVEATPDGLRITPHLPKALEYAEVRSLSWRSNALRVRVTHTSVEIEGTTEDRHPFKRHYSIRPGESISVPIPR